jgi:hypothetical protein
MLRCNNVQYSRSNKTHFFVFILLRINSLYMFSALFAHHQEALYTQHFVYWLIRNKVKTKSASCWFYYTTSNTLRCTVNNTLNKATLFETLSLLCSGVWNILSREQILCCAKTTELIEHYDISTFLSIYLQILGIVSAYSARHPAISQKKGR